MNRDNIDIAELVTLSQSGDMDAYAKLYAATYSTLYGVAMSVCADPYEAQDGVQDAYLRIYNSLSSLAKPENFVSWSKRITYNICLRRMSRKRDILSGDIVTVADITLDASPSPEYFLETTERQDALIDAVDSLPEKYQQVFKLKNYDQRTVLEIAELLQCPEGTVKSRLSTARKLIIRKLKSDGTFYSFGMWLYPAAAFIPMQVELQTARATSIASVVAGAGFAASESAALIGQSSSTTASSVVGATSSKSTSLVSRVGQYGTQMAGSSSMAPIACGVAATVAVGGISVATFNDYQDTANDNVLIEGSVAPTVDTSIQSEQVVDLTLPLMRDYTSIDGIFTVFVEDSDSGIDYNSVYCVTVGGSHLVSQSFDSITGAVEFAIPDSDFTLYVSDNFGNVQDYHISIASK